MEVPREEDVVETTSSLAETSSSSPPTRVGSTAGRWDHFHFLILLSLSLSLSLQVEPPVSTQRKEGVTGFTFPITPLANRIYSEEDDMEMDVWLQIDLANNVRELEDKSLTLVVTPFKKSCASRDLLYRQCR